MIQDSAWITARFPGKHLFCFIFASGLCLFPAQRLVESSGNKGVISWFELFKKIPLNLVILFNLILKELLLKNSS